MTVTCRYDNRCSGPAVAYVRDTFSPDDIPTCRWCVDRYLLREAVVAAVDSPPAGA